jgi:hypothetical protein
MRRAIPTFTRRFYRAALTASPTLGILLSFGLLVPTSLHATTVRVTNLQDLLQSSQRIFVGTCISVEDDATGSIPFTVYTFEVLEKIKGVSVDTITIRQFGLSKPIAVGNGLVRTMTIQGMPTYESGKEYLLFLVGESPIGLSSPVGLAQGVFRYRHEGFVNALDNRNLARGLPENWLRAKGLTRKRADDLMRLQKGPIDAGFFVDVLKTLAQER